MMAESRRQGTSPWVYIGCGCATLALLAVAAMVGAGFFGASLMKSYVEDLEDPAARTERALEMLGTDALPEGFHAQMFFKVPWILDVVVLSDGEPADLTRVDGGDRTIDSEELGDRAFLYLALKDVGDARRDVEQAWEREDLSQVSHQLNFDFQARRPLDRGEFDAAPHHVRWMAFSGEISGQRERADGIYTMLLIDCETPDDLVRMAYFWARADLETLTADDRPDLTGTPADPAALRDFLGHFDLCR